MLADGTPRIDAGHPQPPSPRKLVLFVHPPAWFSEGEPRVFEREAPPLGLLYLAAWLQAHSDRFTVRVVDLGPERMGLAAFRRLVAATRPFVVGISAMTTQLQGARDVAARVRQAAPRCPISLGGNHVSGDPAFVTRNADLDDLPFPGSGLVERAREAGVIDEGVIDRFARQALGAGVTGIYPLFLEGLDHRTVIRAMRRTYRRFYLRPRVFLDLLARVLSSPAPLARDARSALYLVRRGPSCRKPFE